MKIVMGKNGAELIGTPHEIAKWVLNNQRRFKLNRYNIIVNCGVKNAIL